MTKKIKLTFCGGVQTVTGANFLLEGEGFKFLVDCGLTQGTDFADNVNHSDFIYDPKSIDYLIVTHSHIDHIGRIGKLIKDGFKGKIVSTPATKSLAVVMLDDAVKVINDEARHKGVLPLYEKVDIDKALNLWQTLEYHKTLNLTPEVTLLFQDSGHILGSAMANISYGSKKIVLTGDLGNSPSLLLRDTEALKDVDYLVMESVYGDRNHESHEERRAKLKSVLAECISKKKTLLIPVFSLERTQVILFEMNEIFENGELQEVPVFLDSPLAARVTEIYKQYTEDFNQQARAQVVGGDDIFKFPRLKYTPKAVDSAQIENTPNPKIIMAGSGMSNGGRILQHEKYFLSDKNAEILLVGYQAVGTLGRLIQDGVREVEINKAKIRVNCKVEMVNGYSSHKDSDHLVEFVGAEAQKLKQVFVVMGEPKTSMFLIQRLKDELGVNALHPQLNKSYDLDF